jgi:hypothetical protein
MSTNPTAKVVAIGTRQPVRRCRYAYLWEEEGSGMFTSWRTCLIVGRRANGDFVISARQTALDDTYGSCSVYRSRPFRKPARLLEELRRATKEAWYRSFSTAETVRALSRLAELDVELAGQALREVARSLASSDERCFDLLPD